MKTCFTNQAYTKSGYLLTANYTINYYLNAKTKYMSDFLHPLLPELPQSSHEIWTNPLFPTELLVAIVPALVSSPKRSEGLGYPHLNKRMEI